MIKVIHYCEASEGIRYSVMEPAKKKRKSIMEDGFELLTRIYRWNDIEVDKAFKVKQIVNGKALLEDNTGEQLITDLPGSVLEKISGDKDLSIFSERHGRM